MALVADLPALRRQLNVAGLDRARGRDPVRAAWLVWLSADIYGASIVEVCLHGGVWSVLTETRFGLVWIARLGLAILLGVLMLWPAARLLQLAAAACLLALIALIGHAGATPGTAGQIHLASDIVHLLAAGAWLGALPALTMLLGQTAMPAIRIGRHAVTAARRFSLLGMVSVSALLASGVVNSWNLLGGPRDLVTTDYGRLVLLKIGLFVAMVGIAAVNRFHLTPQLPAAGALKALRRNSLAEIGLGLCALLFVGALGTCRPAAMPTASARRSRPTPPSPISTPARPWPKSPSSRARPDRPTPSFAYCGKISPNFPPKPCS